MTWHVLQHRWQTCGTDCSWTGTRIQLESPAAPWKQTVAHVNAEFPSSSATKPLLTTPSSLMALQLPNWNASETSASSSRNLKDNDPFRRLCLYTTHLTWRCSFLGKELRTPLITQRTAILPRLPPPRLNHPTDSGQKNIGSPRMKNQTPSSPITQRSVKAAAGPSLARRWSPTVPQPPSRRLRRRTNGRGFPNF